LDGKLFDMNIPEPDQLKIMIESHKKAMAIAADFGCKTYTVHVGAHHYCNEKISLDILRPLALESLEKLLPTAEKLGIIIAVENSFEKPNSAKEVLSLVTPFDGNPAIGVCYDAGHANCMRSVPGKKHEDYPEYFRNSWWDKGVEFEDGALELLKPHVVTCHLHDNNGLSDLHALPGDGTVCWDDLITKLQECPRMLDFQSEVNCVGGTNWAGLSPAPAGGYSIRRLTETFRKLGFQDSVK
jgi:sugar phosphate isomerase/epimerase